jgi:hypothetical protein
MKVAKTMQGGGQSQEQNNPNSRCRRRLRGKFEVRSIGLLERGWINHTQGTSNIKDSGKLPYKPGQEPGPSRQDQCTKEGITLETRARHVE